MSKIELPEVELLHELDHIANDWEYGLPTHDDSLMDKMREAVREYGKACARAAMERAAQVCDGLTVALDNGGNEYRREAAASRCAAAIRAEMSTTNTAKLDNMAAIGKESQ